MARTATAPQEKAPRPPVFFNVPPNATWSECSCGKRQYWIRSKHGKRMSIDCDVEGGLLPTMTGGPDGTQAVIGHGVAHFATCPHADRYRKRGGSRA